MNTKKVIATVLAASLLAVMAGCGPSYKWIVPDGMTRKDASVQVYRCQYEAAMANQGLLTTQNTFLMLQARRNEQNMFEVCMQAHGFVKSATPPPVKS